MDAHETTATPVRRRLDRRTVLKGAAWSVPAVVVVGVTPAFAQSGVPLTVDSVAATRGTGQNNARVTFTLTLLNSNNFDVSVTNISIGTNAGWADYDNISVGTIAAASTEPGTGTVSFRARETGEPNPAYPLLSITLVDGRGSTFNISYTIPAGTT